MQFSNISSSMLVLLLLSLLIPGRAAFSNSTDKEPIYYDVVVIGGTPAGIGAAVAAGRAGLSVMLVEQSPVLGGTLSSGVSRLDDYLKEANSGVMDEFRQRVRDYHLSELSDDPIVMAHLEAAEEMSDFMQQGGMSRWSAAEGRAWEPKTAARIFGEMIAEVPTVTTRFGEVPIETIVEGDRVVAVITRERDLSGQLGDEHRYEGHVFIDATYEADVAAFAGVPYRIGREARSREEPHAGKIYTDAFCSERAAISMRGTIFPGSSGEGDERTQAFTFRFVAKDYGQEDHPYRLESPPPGYDASLYNWNPNTSPHLPNNKADMLGPTGGGDLAGLSTRYTLGGWEERAEIEEIYRNHELGWLYYIQTEGGSPEWGLADDEFTDNNNWPYRVYVRQGRRIEGLYTLKESDLHKDLRGNGLRGPLHRESVAIGIYPMDVHNVQNPVDVNAPCGEGAIHLNDVTGPYQIPYGVMVPKNRKGLLVPVGISSTHVAMSSVRMEPVWTSLGQAAGVAAAIAVDSGLEVNEVPVTGIQDELLQQHSMLFFYKDLPEDSDEFKAVQTLSLSGAVDGDKNYYFRPNQPITKGEFARMIVKGLDIPLSITAQHFDDVPREHSAFQYIETLYDYSTQSDDPFLSYEIRNSLNYWWGSSSRHGPPAFAYPDEAITSESVKNITDGLIDVISFGFPDHPVSGIASEIDSKVLIESALPSADANYTLNRVEAALIVFQLRSQAGINGTGKPIN